MISFSMCLRQVPPDLVNNLKRIVKTKPKKTTVFTSTWEEGGGERGSMTQ